MQGVRPPAVAGLFYPDERTELLQLMDQFLQEVADAEPQAAAATAPPKAIIAPHAGYRYSGPIAASAFELLRPLAGQVDRVVLLGPSHRVAFHGLALPAADRFETPLGPVEIDLEAAESVLDLPQVGVDSAPHAQEHSLEVEVPFLLQVLGSFRLVPLVVGFATPEEVAEVLERLWGGDETRIIVSSDLSHFLDYETARRLDNQTAQEIVELRSNLVSKQACGAIPINGLTLAARRQGLAPRLLDLRNSGDTAGGHDQVVGYGAFSFTATEAG
ncbi:MAG: AmmeMemoRadiSam system protein B [bacterium]|nr:AmmeMemoRadiSam system protein B [bacterium]